MPLTPYTILAVEDDRAIGSLLEELLQEEGYTVTRATSGEHAVQVMEDGDVDAVLLDVRIPGIDGLQILQRVRAAESGNTRHLPIMLLSGAATEPEREAGLAAGADDYLSKPFEIGELLERLARLLGQRDAPAAAANLAGAEA